MAIAAGGNSGGDFIFEITIGGLSRSDSRSRAGSHTRKSAVLREEPPPLAILDLPKLASVTKLD